MLRKGRQFLLHMFISSSWEFYFKIYSNTANYKLWTSMTGTLQTQLVVFICAYLYSITCTRKLLFFYFPHAQLSTIDPGVFLNNLNLHVITMLCSKYYIGSWEENIQYWVQNQTDKTRTVSDLTEWYPPLAILWCSNFGIQVY
jgi:hypothetical protein